MKIEASILAGCFIAAAAALIVSAASRLMPALASESALGVAAREPSPAWELNDLDSKVLKSSDFTGKVVILDFWATWCRPCRMEIPGFIELQKQYADKGLVIVGVSLDQSGVSAVKPFMEKMGINYPIVLGDETVTRAFGGIEGIPTTFIIDRTGNIVHKHVGYAHKEEFEADIKPLL